jgi:hypothetical protein
MFTVKFNSHNIRDYLIIQFRSPSLPSAALVYSHIRCPSQADQLSVSSGPREGEPGHFFFRIFFSQQFSRKFLNWGLLEKFRIFLRYYFFFAKFLNFGLLENV